MSPVRVLVVDDSALMRKLIPQILQTDSSIEVVGTAMDGNFGLRKIEDLKPQVVTLDLEMPGMGGIDMLKEIMRRHRLPVIVVSSHSTQGASITLQALSLGAFDFVAKPNDVSARMPQIAAELIGKIKAAAQSRGVTIRQVGVTPRPGKKAPLDAKKTPTKVIAIGVSTGGPQALQYVFSQLPADFPGSIVVVQHMPEGFTEMFARRLDDSFQPGRGAPATVTMDTLTSWSDSQDKGVKYFSGTGTYTKTIQASADWLKPGATVWIDLGVVKNLAEVTVNGKSLGVAWHAPYRMDVTSALKPGANDVMIKVTNAWVNRLIGDQQPDATTKYTFADVKPYKANSPLLPSGLLGPVKLEKETAQ
jgi:DNA-binding NarL/FixJ family response regulator